LCDFLQVKNKKNMKSSINIQPVKFGSEQHNNREKELDYVRADLSYLNSSFKTKTIEEAKQFAEKNCKEKTGRAMQSKATPIREGVLLIERHHTAADLKRIGQKLEERFGIKTIQGYCHKDEGHYDKITNEWKPNYHAHMVFEWTDHKTGKSLKLNRQDMAEVQTIVAQELGLERGHSSHKEHLTALQFKNHEEAKKLEITEKLVLEHSQVENYFVQGILGQNDKKTVAGLKTALKAEVLERYELKKEIEQIKGSLGYAKQEIKNLKSKQEEILKKAEAYFEEPNKRNEIGLKLHLSHIANSQYGKHKFEQEFDKFLREGGYKQDLKKDQNIGKNKGQELGF
jgi:hypothetical protein